MVAIIKNLIPDSSTDAAFRAWGSGISQCFDDFSLFKTADTGQIDWTTVTKPAAINTVQGYEIRRFSDSLQSTAPILFKIEYGAPSGIANFPPGIRLTLGVGSNGAGGINQQASSVYLLNARLPATVGHTCVFSGAPNRVAGAMFTNLNDAAFFFSIERTKNAQGNDTAEGILFTAIGANSNTAYKTIAFIPINGVIPPVVSDTGIQMPPGVSSGVFGSDVGLYPNFFYRGGLLLYPGLTHLGYFTQDVVVSTTKAISFYGVERMYYFLGGLASIANVGRGSPSGSALAMLYE
jgi:hypothetical protein